MQTYHFDIHGFRLEVHGKSVGEWFDFEYNSLRVGTPFESPDLIIQKNEAGIPTPIKPRGMNKGIAITGAHPKVLSYDEGINPQFVMMWAEALFEWPNKCMAHAGGVARDGRGYIFFAGPNTGKTSSVLQLVQRGYSYVSDDWVVIGEGGCFPLPKTVHVYDYNFAADRALSKRLLGRVIPWHRLMRVRLQLRNKYLPKIPSRALRLGGDFLLSLPVKYVTIDELLPGAKVAPPARLAAAIWMSRYDGDRIDLSEISAANLANRITNTTLHEQARFFAWHALESAVHGGDLVVEDRLARERKILVETLQKVNCKLIQIPRACTPAELVDFLENHVLDSGGPAK